MTIQEEEREKKHLVYYFSSKKFKVNDFRELIVNLYVDKINFFHLSYLRSMVLMSCLILDLMS